jgi:hypothetical protein
MNVPPPPPAPPPGPAAYGPARNDNGAIASLVCGIVGIACIPLVGIVALVLGLRARNRIDSSMGELGGRGMATAGIVLGVLAIVEIVIVLIVAIAANMGS